MRHTTLVTDDVYSYLLEHSMPADDVVAALVEETSSALPDRAGMQVGGEQGRLLHLLVKLMGARQLLEIGTFTGMSALWMARALPPDGHLLCLDVSEEWTAIARRYWERAGVDHLIELEIGPALDTLRTLAPEPMFDLAFIDADKGNYPNYLDEVVPRLHPGGLMVADNVLWSGKVVDGADETDDTEAIRRFNRIVVDHPDLEAVVLPISDGMTLARRRS
ncbi:MAG TPA: O-methyltransferase [Acidimicrobiia bacterium]|nr:O-methyltransferase [Acidimicrobiia bacterium]